MSLLSTALENARTHLSGSHPDIPMGIFYVGKAAGIWLSDSGGHYDAHAAFMDAYAALILSNPDTTKAVECLDRALELLS